ncbi:MAG: ribose 5-phosphate isomerase B [Propionibacteriaceae bacterium]
MLIAFGSDHAGFALRHVLMDYVAGLGHEVLDLGCPEPERVDYPVYGAAVGRAVVSGQAELGIAVCGSGIGISIAANKVPGVRAAVCSEGYSARLSRQHNNANVLCMGERVVGEDVAKMMVDEFLTAQFQGGRHAERVALLTALDEEQSA